MKRMILILVVGLALSFSCTQGGSGGGEDTIVDLKGNYTVVSSGCGFADVGSTFYVGDSGKLMASMASLTESSNPVNVETKEPKEGSDQIVDIENAPVPVANKTESLGTKDTEISGLSGNVSAVPSGSVTASITVEDVDYSCSGDFSGDLVILSCATNGSAEPCILTAERYVSKPEQSAVE